MNRASCWIWITRRTGCWTGLAKAMVVAGLAAEGETEITGIHHIDRGYDDLVGRLAAVGAHAEGRGPHVAQ